jgi:hypothetical protein
LLRRNDRALAGNVFGAAPVEVKSDDSMVTFQPAAESVASSAVRVMLPVTMWVVFE